jgi:DNA excision repair protein ERCC-2
MGQQTRQYLLDHGKRPRSYLGSVGDFLCRWFDSIDSHTIRLIGKKPLRLEKVCLDPRIMTGFLEDTAGVVSMSGTISPLDMFRDLVGLKSNTILEKVESIFPLENKKVLYLDDVTTSYAELNSKPSLWNRIVSKLELITNNFNGNIALFFPSYKLLELALESLKLKKPVYREYSGMDQEELMQTVESFKSDSGAVLAGVMGGRLAEGIDYPDTSLEMAVIVGIPYPSPGVRQNALQHYYDISFNGRGWKFAVESPAVRKLLQAAGRVIRSENDRGLIIIADNRTGRFLEYIPELERSDDIVSEISDFFEA